MDPAEIASGLPPLAKTGEGVVIAVSQSPEHSEGEAWQSHCPSTQIASALPCLARTKGVSLRAPERCVAISVLTDPAEIASGLAPLAKTGEGVVIAVSQSPEHSEGEAWQSHCPSTQIASALPCLAKTERSCHCEPLASVILSRRRRISLSLRVDSV
jgi:hypothetical protein